MLSQVDWGLLYMNYLLSVGVAANAYGVAWVVLKGIPGLIKLLGNHLRR